MVHFFLHLVQILLILYHLTSGEIFRIHFLCPLELHFSDIFQEHYVVMNPVCGPNSQT
jgi:hypothetical protein